MTKREIRPDATRQKNGEKPGETSVCRVVGSVGLLNVLGMIGSDAENQFERRLGRLPGNLDRHRSERKLRFAQFAENCSTAVASGMFFELAEDATAVTNKWLFLQAVGITNVA